MNRGLWIAAADAIQECQSKVMTAEKCKEAIEAFKLCLVAWLASKIFIVPIPHWTCTYENNDLIYNTTYTYFKSYLNVRLFQ